MQVVAYSAVIFILCAGVLRWAIKNDKKHRQPIQIPNGVPAKGIILDFHKSSGNFLQPASGSDDVYRTVIRIQVTNENGDSWMTKTREYVHKSQFKMFRIGNTISVRYDPENINNVIVDGDLHVRCQPQIRNTMG